MDINLIVVAVVRTAVVVAVECTVGRDDDVVVGVTRSSSINDDSIEDDWGMIQSLAENQARTVRDEPNRLLPFRCQFKQKGEE